MKNKLFYNTINPLLLSVINTLMAASEFDVFRLIGGTALSLYRGHRESVDIDLFSDTPYDSIDFVAIEAFFCNTFSYVDTNEYKVFGLGKSYKKMIVLHEQRNLHTHDENQIRSNFSNFKDADDDFDPVCLKGKHWEIIKLDITDSIRFLARHYKSLIN